MRIFARTLLVTGALVIASALGLLVWSWWQMYQLFIIVSSGRSKEFENPSAIMWLAAGLAVTGGFVTGVGVGMPKTRKPAASASPTTSPEQA